MRTLPIAKDFPGFEYRYPVCKKRFLGKCVKTKWHVDKYDLRDPEVRARLRGMGFEAKVRRPPR